MRKKLRLTLYIVAVLWIAVISQIIVNKCFISERRIMDAFIGSDTEVQESKVVMAIDCSEKYLTESDQKSLIAHFANVIGLDKDYEITSSEKEDKAYLIAKKKGKNANTSIAIESKEEPEKGMLYKVYIKIQVYEKFESILNYKEKLEKAAKDIKAENCRCYTQYKGCYDGELNEKQRSIKLSELLSKVQAKTVKEGYDDKGNYLVYAYTGLVENYIKEPKMDRFNIHIVVHYDEESDKTEIWLATPLMNDPY